MPYKDKEKQKEKNRVYQKAHYQKKKQYYKDKASERQNKIKKEFIEIKSSLKCISCGEDNIACLDFHHLDSSQKEIEVSKAVALGWSIERIKLEINKCIVLCSNCHRKHHAGYSIGNWTVS